MIHRNALIAVVFVVFSFSLGTPVVVAQTAREYLSTSRYSPEEQSTIISVIRHVTSRTIPESLLIPRLAEGIAKDVPASSLIRVLQLEAEYLFRARDLLSSVSGGGALMNSIANWTRTALLLRQGIPEETIEEIAETAVGRPDDFRPATTLYVSLVEWGVSDSLSMRIAVQALKSSLPAVSFPGITDILVSSRRLRLSPDRIGERMIQILPEVSSVDDLRERTLY